MQIHDNIPLKNFTTMKLGGPAKFMTEVFSADDVRDAYNYAKGNNLPVFILGSGSNIIGKDEGFNGLVIRIRIPGFEVVNDDLYSTTIKVGSGEIWDGVVKKAVDMDLSGIEAMSGIPGTIGAAPVQNLGAYGQEISETLQTIEAFDSSTGQVVQLSNEDCQFSYRDSIFRDRHQGRYTILSITLKLSKSHPAPPFYESLQTYLDQKGISIFTSGVIRDAVIAIRQEKLPDPKVTPNSGSFFKNPIIEKWQLDGLKAKYPDMPSFDMPEEKYKIPSGWLIEKTGLKGQLISGIRIYNKNALVLVNESAASYKDLDKARGEIVGKVRDLFQIQLEQEPIEI